MDTLNKYFFSILIPAYKAQYLEECIDSVLAQTYNNFELIIVNDASPQDLDSIINKYQDKRIHYYKNKRGFGAENVVGNWNKCLEYASGDYIICMGDDDKLMPNCLEEYVKLIKKYPGVGLLHGWTEIIDENSTPFKPTTHRCEYESAISLIWHRVMGKYDEQFIGDFCFEANWLKNNRGFYNLPFGWESDDITAYLGSSKNGVANTQCVVFQYRRNKQTISNSGNYQKKIVALEMANDIIMKFIANPCNNHADELYRKELISKATQKLQKSIGLVISGDLKKHGITRLLHWTFLKRKMHINIKTLGYALVQSLK